MVFSIDKIISQYAGVEINSPDTLIAGNYHLRQVFSDYINSGEADLDSVNKMLRFLKRRLDLIESCPDKDVKKQELTKFEQLIISADRLGRQLRAAPPKLLAPPTLTPRLTNDPWDIIVSMSDMKDKDQIAAVSRQTNSAISRDPAFQFLKIYNIMRYRTDEESEKFYAANNTRSMSAEQVKILRKKVAEEIMQVIQKIKLPNSKNHRYLSELKKIKLEILEKGKAIERTIPILLVMGNFLRNAVEFLDDKSMQFINEFIIDPLINGVKDYQEIVRLDYYACIIDLPNNDYLGPLVARFDYYHARSPQRPMNPKLEKYKAQVEGLIKLLGPLNDFDREVQMDLKPSKVRAEISDFLNDPQFMRALFLLDQVLSKKELHGEELVDLLFEGQEKITNPQLVEAIVRYAPSILKYADPRLLKDREFMLKLCQTVNHAESILGYAIFGNPKNANHNHPKDWEGTLLNDAKFMLDLLDFSPKSQWQELLKHTGWNLRQNREFILHIVKKGGGVFLINADEVLRNDQEIVKIAVQEDGSSLQYASEHCREDRDIVLAAIKENGRAFNFAAIQLRNDREVVLATFQSLGRADRQMLLNLTEVDIEGLFGLVGDRLKKDPEVITLYQRARSIYLLASSAILLRKQGMKEKGDMLMLEALKLKVKPPP